MYINDKVRIMMLWICDEYLKLFIFYVYDVIVIFVFLIKDVLFDFYIDLYLIVVCIFGIDIELGL